MAFVIKSPRNYLPYLVQHSMNTDFHHIINSSKYLYIHTADAPIYVTTFREFRANTKLSQQNKKPFLITSTVNKEHAEITKESTSTMFHLKDMTGMETFPKNDLQGEFIERGYEGQLVGATCFKPKFPPEMKFFFHTLLVCLYTKTTAFNEIPLKSQCLGYAILRNLNHKLSQMLFLDLEANLRAIKRGTGNHFLTYPRLLRFYLKNVLRKESFEKSEALQGNSLSKETFTRMMAKSHENVLENQAIDVATSITEPTAPGDHGANPSIVEPTPDISIQPSSIPITNSKRKTTKRYLWGLRC
ncbi:hypothetical protein Hanom_Chr11g01024231 [Helianthus anomalus]